MTLSRILAASIALLLAAGHGAALDWQLEDLDEPQSMDNISKDQFSGQLIRVKDSGGDTVPTSQLRGSETVLEYRPSSGSSYKEMEPLGDGYWTGRVSTSSETNVSYRLLNRSSSENKTEWEIVTPGNLSVSVVDGNRSGYRPGEELKFSANVTSPDGSAESNAEVELTFAGIPSPYSLELGYNDGLYSNLGTVPDRYNQSFVAHINATAGSYLRGYGSVTLFSSTYPRQPGEVEYLNSSGGCEGSGYFRCERGGNISTGFNVTVGEYSPDSGTLELHGNNSSGDLEKLEEVNMSRNGGLWTAEMQVHDIDSTEHGRNLTLRYNFTDGEDILYQDREIVYLPFAVQDRGELSAFQGESYEIGVAALKPVSLAPLDPERIDSIEADIDEPSDSDFEDLETDDFDERTSLYRHSLDIPGDAEKGTYSADYTLENVNGREKTVESGFQVMSRDATFNVSGDLAEQYSSLELSTSLNFTNRESELNWITVNTTGEVENLSTNDDPMDAFALQAGETREVTLEADLGEVDSYTGSVNFSDNSSGYNRTVDYSFTPPESCSIYSGSVCINSSDTDFQVDQAASMSEAINISNLGNGTAEVSANVSGNISGMVELEPKAFNLSGWRTVGITLEPLETGYREGSVDFSWSDRNLSHGLTAEINEALSRPEVEMAGRIELTEVSRGRPATYNLDVSNTGNVELQSAEARSDSYSVTASMDSIAPGEQGEVTLQFEGVEQSSGQLEITFLTESDVLVRTVEVNAQLSLDYERRIERLKTRLDSLDSDTEDQEIMSRIRSLRTNLSRTEAQFDQGRQESASSSLEAVEMEIEELESQVQSTGGGSSNETSGSPETGPEQGSGGGVPILPILVVLLVLLGAGGVFAVSYVPEEGDPLYGVLGEG